MSEPSREHVDAVARVMADDWNPDRDPILTAMFSDYADTVLTSTDPAVLDAMQDALVRAGRLTEEEATRPKWEVCTDLSHNHLIFGSGGAISHVSEWVTVRRALTDWREVDDA